MGILAWLFGGPDDGFTPGGYDKDDAAEDCDDTIKGVSEAWHFARSDYQNDPQFSDDHGRWDRDPDK